MKTIIEPFKIKMVEPLKLTTPDEREAILRRAWRSVGVVTTMVTSDFRKSVWNDGSEQTPSANQKRS